MKDNGPLITITEYSMSTARGVILDSTSFDSVDNALKLPSLCARTHSIVIKNNKSGTSFVYNPDSANPVPQLEQEFKELFQDEFTKT